MGSAGQEAIELAAKAGLFLYPWQRYVMERALGERDDGKWSAFEACVIVPRQNGKTALLLARTLAGLLLFGDRLILWSSQLDSTNLESFRSLKELIEENDFLNLRIKTIRETNGQVTVEFKGGQRVRFVCRSSHSGRGFTADCVIFDEAYKLDPAIMGALTPTLLNRPNPQMWYTSSAPRAESAQLWAVRRRGISGGDAARLAFLEWSVDPDAYDPASVEAWATANPTLGAGNLNVENLQAVYASMPRAEWIREICGVPDPEPAPFGELAIDPEAWSASFDGQSKAVGALTFAFDVSPDGRLCSIAVAGPRADGLMHVEVLHHREPSVRWIVETTSGLCERWDAQLIVGPTAANAYLPDLERAKVPVVHLTERDLAAACVRFKALVNQGGLRHLGSGDLAAAVATAIEAPRGDAFIWKRRLIAAPDLSPLYAVTLAAWPQTDQPAKSIMSF